MPSQYIPHDNRRAAALYLAQRDAARLEATTLPGGQSYGAFREAFVAGRYAVQSPADPDAMTSYQLINAKAEAIKRQKWASLRILRRAAFRHNTLEEWYDTLFIYRVVKRPTETLAERAGLGDDLYSVPETEGRRVLGKKCASCHREYPRNAKHFERRKDTLDHLSFYCRTCKDKQRGMTWRDLFRFASDDGAPR